MKASDPLRKKFLERGRQILLDSFPIKHVAFLLPAMDPPTHRGGAHACLPRDAADGPAGNPQDHEHAAFRQTGWLGVASLQRPLHVSVNVPEQHHAKHR